MLEKRYVKKGVQGLQKVQQKNIIANDFMKPDFYLLINFCCLHI